jgi:cephalosporin hydroxylase
MPFLGPKKAAIVQQLVQEQQPQLAVEVGTMAGYSAIKIAQVGCATWCVSSCSREHSSRSSMIRHIANRRLVLGFVIDSGTLKMHLNSSCEEGHAHQCPQICMNE